MSSATPSQVTPPAADDKIDKDALYGRYQKHEDARDRLGLKMAYKALDIPQDDDMNISVTHNNYGTASVPEAVASAIAPSASPAPAPAGLASMLPKLVLGAGLAATGVGLPAAAMIGASVLPQIAQMFAPKQTTQPTSPVQLPGEVWDSTIDMIVDPTAPAPATK